MSRYTRLRARSPRTGFTLVELLVAVVIIAILAGLVFGALRQAREAARIAKTRATIAKINEVIMAQYDNFRTRRVDLQYQVNGVPQARPPKMPPVVAAKFRLWAIRMVMAMEMPDRYDDINPAPSRVPFPLTFTQNVGGNQITAVLPRTSLAMQYYRRYQAAPPTPEYDSAEALYLTVTVGSRGSRELFSDNEIGDVDNDGYLEFIDGWGHPINFIRYAPAFTESDIQAHPNDAARAAQEDHDPFDPLRVDPGAWRLVPLIYSAGPDGKKGLVVGEPNPSGPGEKWVYYEQWQNWYSSPIGGPVPSTSAEYRAHFDNIHNHLLEGVD
ncbi:hypothetical protein JCM19992_04420 [Thermostilla marina]